jgi:hypothetical protein
MNIQQAINLLSGENHKYFVEQINHFKIDTSSQLKDYLDFINSDIIGWFKSAPENIKAESTYYKFKSPINNLLEHKNVIEQCEHTYCTTLAKNITKTFSKYKKDIIKRNKSISINQHQAHTPSSSHDTETNDYSDNEPDNNSGLGDPDDLEYADPLKYKTDIDYKNKYESLQQIHNNLQDDYNALMKDHQYLKGQYERCNSELIRVWDFLNKFVSK